MLSEMMVMSVLYYTNTLNWFFHSAISLKQHSRHIILIPSHQTFLLLINAPYLVEKEQIPILIVFGFMQPGFETHILMDSKWAC